MIVPENSQFASESAQKEYGEACLRLGLELSAHYLPPETVAPLFESTDFQDSLEHLTCLVAMAFPYNTLSKLVAPNDPSHDLRTMLERAPDPDITDCRVDVFMTAAVLARDGLADSTGLANVPFSRSPFHAMAVVTKDETPYTVRFGNIHTLPDQLPFVISAVQKLDASDSERVIFPLTDLGIFEFEFDARTLTLSG